jgi:Domain of unknown function (DUF4349)
MTSREPSPELAALLRGSRPAASPELRARVREIAAGQAVKAPPLWSRLRLPSRRGVLVVLPAAAALAIASAGVLGLVRSDGGREATVADRTDQSYGQLESGAEKAIPRAASPLGAADATAPSATAQGAPLAGTGDRAQRVTATMTLEVTDSDGVASSAQKAIALTQRLGGHVVNSAVVTGEGANALLTLRVPVARVQEAVAGLSALGTIVSQQVSTQDLQADLDRLERRERSVRAQIALLVARLESDSLDAGQQAIFEARLKNLRNELRALRLGIAGTNAEARMASIQMTVVTPDGSGVAPVPSRIDSTLDEALNVLVWEGVVALAILIVAAPFALVAFAIWLGNRLYRRREDDRLLTAN